MWQRRVPAKSSVDGNGPPAGATPGLQPVQGVCKPLQHIARPHSPRPPQKGTREGGQGVRGFLAFPRPLGSMPAVIPCFLSVPSPNSPCFKFQVQHLLLFREALPPPSCPHEGNSMGSIPGTWFHLQPGVCLLLPLKLLLKFTSVYCRLYDRGGTISSFDT